MAYGPVSPWANWPATARTKKKPAGPSRTGFGPTGWSGGLNKNLKKKKCEYTQIVFIIDSKVFLLNKYS